MKYTAKTLRTFIGSKNFTESREFYKALGFKEVEISKDMVLIKINDQQMFYLQDYYVKDWNNNLMMFLEVDDIDYCFEDIRSKQLDEKYRSVRISEIKHLEWGKEFFVHDPSGVLWHFGIFNN